MNKELVKLANHLDKLGHRDLADRLDNILKSATWIDKFKDTYKSVLAKAGEIGGASGEKAKQWANTQIEQLKNQASRGSDAARRSLEVLSEDDTPIVAGLAQAAIAALEAMGHQPRECKPDGKTLIRLDGDDKYGYLLEAGNKAYIAYSLADCKELGRSTKNIKRVMDAAGVQSEEAAIAKPEPAEEVTEEVTEAEIPTLPSELLPQLQTLLGKVKALTSTLRLPQDSSEVVEAQKLLKIKRIGIWKGVTKDKLIRMLEKAIKKAGAAPATEASDGLFGEARRKQDRINKLAELMSGEFTVNTPGSFRR